MNSNLRLRMIVGGAEQQRDSLFGWGSAPGFEGVKRRGHGDLHLRRAGLLMHADHLRRPRRIDGANLVRGLQPLAADDQAVLGAQVRGHMIERVAHGARILGVVEIGKGLIRKHAPRRARLDRGETPAIAITQ